MGESIVNMKNLMNSGSLLLTQRLVNGVQIVTFKNSPTESHAGKTFGCLYSIRKCRFCSFTLNILAKQLLKMTRGALFPKNFLPELP